MRYIFLTDNPVLLESFRNIPKGSDAFCVIEHDAEGFRKKESREFGDSSPWGQGKLFDIFRLQANDRILFHYNDKSLLAGSLEMLLEKKTIFQGMVVLNAKGGIWEIGDLRISFVALQDLLGGGLSFRWEYLSAQGKVQKLKALLEPARNILILMQHDPDPDAIASALAVRTLLNRNRVSAPIGTFGQITWSENRAMVRLLDIDVLQVNAESIQKFDKIVLVDAQPPYFEGLHDRFDAVIDHHPHVTKMNVPFMDIRTSYGATATILTEYLIASNTPMNQRLATALLYGLKTDTLFLGREVSANDFEAFKVIWPLANHNLLRKMERPELGPDEIASFIKALKHKEIFGRTLYTFLGEVEREDIIPRLADFCLQIGGVEWSVVCGLCSGNIIISVRNIGNQRSAGSLLSKLFGHLGKAGGHGSMAKAVAPIKEFKRAFGVGSLRKISEKILEIFKRELE